LGVDAEQRPLVMASGGWPDGRFIALLGTRLPIVQAPMANAGGVELAVGAIEGGAVGSLPCAMLTPEEVRTQATEVRARARGPLNLNFFCHVVPEPTDDSAWRALLEPFYRRYPVSSGTGDALRRPFDESMCAVVEEVRPELVSFHFGLPPRALLARVRATGAKLIGNATTVEEARWLAANGVDAIIAQGWEAGGHAGRFLGGRPDEQMGLFALLPQIVDATALPVIAAGGVADGRGIAAALTLGAAAVQIGTAYLHGPESLVSPAHRAALASDAAERTTFTNLFSGGRARGLWTAPMEELGPLRLEAPPFPLAAVALAPLAKAAAARGESGFRPMWSGQAARLGKALPAAELTARLGHEALARLSGSRDPPGLLLNIDVPDLEAGIAFYTSALGLVLSRRLGADFVELSGAVAPIYLLKKDGGTAIGPAGADVRRYGRHWSPIHPDFAVDDLDSAIARAVAAGAVQEGETCEAAYGRLAMFGDPFGHGFCLIEFNEKGYGAIRSGSAPRPAVIPDART
jgi:nitronate monooxygenase